MKVLFDKIESINSNICLKCIAEKVRVLNGILDIHDSAIDNLISDLSQFFANNEKTKIKRMLLDFYKYDKKNRKGDMVYN